MSLLCSCVDLFVFFCLFLSNDGSHLTFLPPPFFFFFDACVCVVFLAPFFIFPFHKRREDPSIPADQAARTWLGSLAAVDTGTSTQARRARRERRERRARIRGGTATEDDFDAEIDAQERELAAAIKKREEIDLELRTTTAEKNSTSRC